MAISNRAWLCTGSSMSAAMKSSRCRSISARRSNSNRSASWPSIWGPPRPRCSIAATMFLHDFALPVLQADAVYQTNCFLGSALGRYLIAQELVRLAREEGCDTVGPQRRQQGQRSGPHGNGHRRPGSQAEGAGPGARMEPEEPRRQADLRPQARLPVEEPEDRAGQASIAIFGA